MIDLADYTKPIRDQLKRRRFACVYIAGIETPKACRVGYPEDLVPAVARLRRSAPAEVTISSALWCRTGALLQRSQRRVHCDLASHTKAGGGLSLSQKRPPLPSSWPQCVSLVLSQRWRGTIS